MRHHLPTRLKAGVKIARKTRSWYVTQMQLVLIDPKPELCIAWFKQFSGLPNVEVVVGYFEDLPAFDCMVSAANSFGLMDGGVDAAIVNFFGPALMDRVQQRILEEYLGEQNVGTSLIVETDHPRHPYIAHTPTMRVPMDISRTDNVYRGMWAMLLAVRHHNRHADRQIQRVACPGLGTSAGQVPFSQAAHQMALAYRHFLNPPTHIDWRIADNRQTKILYGGSM